MSEQYVGTDFKDGQKFYWQTDLENAEYVLFVGSNLFDGNYGPPNRSPRIMSRLVDGKTKCTVLDPRFTKLAGKANRWVPILPGTDAAFAMGMTRWILENKRFDAKYLANCNKAAAAVDKESTWCNGAWLVKLDKDGKPAAFLRASEIGLKAKEVRKDKDGKDFDFEYLVAMKDGKPVAFDPNDEKEAVEGELFVTAEIPAEKGPVKVKSGLQVMLETAQEKTIAQYAKICGIDAGVIEVTAKEFTSYGKKASRRYAPRPGTAHQRLLQYLFSDEPEPAGGQLRLDRGDDRRLNMELRWNKDRQAALQHQKDHIEGTEGIRPLSHPPRCQV